MNCEIKVSYLEPQRVQKLEETNLRFKECQLYVKVDSSIVTHLLLSQVWLFLRH